MWKLLLIAALSLLALLVVLAGILWLLVHASRKLRPPLFLLLLCSLVAVPFFFAHIHQRQFMLSVVPDALGVDSVAYSKERSWGFGPGGNEAGIRVYPLPATVARTVSAGGTAFLAHLPANRNARHRGWRGLYGAWAETPVRADSPWKRDEKTARLDIRDYICAYGFCVDIDPAVAAQANAIINRPGSCYAYGRIGMIIISPRTRQVLYLYNG